MDNDDEIKKSLLPSEIIPEFKEIASGAPKLYDLSGEFVKTKFNRNYFVLIVLFLFIISISIVAIGLTTYIEKNFQNLHIDIDDFEDVNLVELLNATKKYENDLNIINRSLLDIQNEIDTKTTEINKEYEANIDTLLKTQTNKSFIQKMSQSYKNQKEMRINAIKSQYNDEITMKLQERDLVLSKIESYDMRQVDKARKNEEMLQSQKQLNDLELKKTIDNYEQKIHSINAEHKKTIAKKDNYYAYQIKNINKKHESDIAALITTYNPVLVDATLDTVNNSSGVYSLDEMTKNFAYFSSILQTIPYINSVPPLIESVIQSAEGIKRELTAIITQLNDDLLIKKSIIQTNTAVISQHRNAFSHYLRNSGDTGIVVNADNLNMITFFYNDIIPVKTGMLVKIFRNDNEYIGSMIIENTNGLYTGKIIEVRQGKSILPFDKLFFDLKSITNDMGKSND